MKLLTKEIVAEKNEVWDSQTGKLRKHWPDPGMNHQYYHKR